MKTFSQKGQLIDFGKLIETQGATIAVGNANLNARGDIVGRGGAIVKTRDEVANDYYNNNPKAVSSFVSLNDIEDEVMTPAAAVAAAIEAAPAPEVVAEIAPPKKKRQSAETED